MCTNKVYLKGNTKTEGSLSGMSNAGTGGGEEVSLLWPGQEPHPDGARDATQSIRGCMHPLACEL